MNSSLTKLALKYDTDKNSLGHNYIEMYEFWLTNRKVNKLLEIGLGNGSSARMWREYFPDAQIYVAELFGDEYKAWNDDKRIFINGVLSSSTNTYEDNINVIRGNATKAELWEKVPNDIDVIIDDGSHNPNDQISSLILGFKKLSSRGLYFIEDTYCNFQKFNIFQTSHDGTDILFPWLTSLIVEQQSPKSPVINKDFYHNRNLMNYPANDIYSYHIYKNAILFEKANMQNNTITIFLSKDRALQLDCALHSFMDSCKDASKTDIIVYYNTSSDRHESSYRQLASEYPKIPFIREGVIKKDIVDIISKYKYFFITVDDNVFYKPFSIEDIDTTLENSSLLGFTLRLGRNTTYCYPVNKEQKLPEFESIKDNIYSYNWTNSDLDFGYAIEISGTVYKVADFLQMLQDTSITTAHQLEANIANKTNFFVESKPLMACYESSVLFSNPLNVTKADCMTNRNANRTEYSTDNLLCLFEYGKRIDISYYKEIIPNAAHYEGGITMKEDKNEL